MRTFQDKCLHNFPLLDLACYSIIRVNKVPDFDIFDVYRNILHKNAVVSKLFPYNDLRPFREARNALKLKIFELVRDT